MRSLGIPSRPSSECGVSSGMFFLTHLPAFPNLPWLGPVAWSDLFLCLFTGKFFLWVWFIQIWGPFTHIFLTFLLQCCFLSSQKWSERCACRCLPKNDVEKRTILTRSLQELASYYVTISSSRPQREGHVVSREWVSTASPYLTSVPGRLAPARSSDLASAPWIKLTHFFPVP